MKKKYLFIFCFILNFYIFKFAKKILKILIVREKSFLAYVLSASVLSVVSCNREEDTSSAVIPPTVKPSENKTKEVTLNVEKATDWKYFSFEAGKEVSVTNPATDKSWDVAFLAYMVKVNGGASTTVDAKGEVYRTEQKRFFCGEGSSC